MSESLSAAAVAATAKEDDVRKSLLAALIASVAGACAAREAATLPPARADLYRCEGCEAALERNASSLDWRAAIAGADEPGEPMTVKGVVYGLGGAKPASGVVIYAYHTNAEGLYANGSAETVWSRRHGRLRGWARTGADGRYEFSTIKPAPYPDETLPAHIHLTVVEPGRPPYWIDDIVFAGEFGVTGAYRAALENRGGEGIVDLARADGVWSAVRDIVLERHPE